MVPSVVVRFNRAFRKDYKWEMLVDMKKDLSLEYNVVQRLISRYWLHVSF